MAIKSNEELEEAMVGFIVEGMSPEDALTELLMSGQIDVPTLDSLGSVTEEPEQIGVSIGDDDPQELFTQPEEVEQPMETPQLSTGVEQAQLTQGIEQGLQDPNLPGGLQITDKADDIDPDAIQAPVEPTALETTQEAEALGQQGRDAAAKAIMESETNPMSLAGMKELIFSKEALAREAQTGNPAEFVWGLLSLAPREFAWVKGQFSGEDIDPRLEGSRAFFTQEIEDARKEIAELRKSGKDTSSDEVRAVAREVLYEMVNDPTIIAGIGKGLVTGFKNIVKGVSPEIAEGAAKKGITQAEFKHQQDINKIFGTEIPIKNESVAKLDEFGGPKQALEDISNHVTSTTGGKPMLNDETAQDFVDRFLTPKFKKGEFEEKTLSGGGKIDVPVKSLDNPEFVDTSPVFKQIKNFEANGLKKMDKEQSKVFYNIVGNKVFDGDDIAARKMLSKLKFHPEGKNGGDVRTFVSKLNRMIKDESLPTGTTQEEIRILRDTLNEHLKNRVTSGLAEFDKANAAAGKATHLVDDYLNIKTSSEGLQESVVGVLDIIGMPKVAKRQRLSQSDISQAKEKFINFFNDAVTEAADGKFTKIEQLKELDGLINMNYANLAERAAVMHEFGSFSNPRILEQAKFGNLGDDEIIKAGTTGNQKSPFISGMDITLLTPAAKGINFVGRQIWDKFGLAAQGKQKAKALRKVFNANDELKSFLKKYPSGELPPRKIALMINTLVGVNAMSATAAARVIKNRENLEEIRSNSDGKNPNFWNAVEHKFVQNERKAKRGK